MLLFEKISNIKNIYHKIILILSFIISWFSIGTHYTNLLIFTPNEAISLIEVINFIRVALNLLCFPILCIMFFTNMSKYNENNINPYVAFLIPLLCLLSQIPGLFYTANSLWNLLYVLSAINILIILNLIILNFENDEIYFIIFLTFILLLIVFFITFKQDIIRYFNSGILFYGRINYLLGDNHIRSSGTSRIAIVLLVIYSIFSIRFVRSKFLLFAPLIFFCSTIILYQSRANIALAIIFITLNYLIYEKYTLKTFFKYSLIYFMMPTMLVFLVFSLQTGINVKENESVQILSFFNLDSEVLKKKIRVLKPGTITTSSGRIDDWKEIINSFDYKNNLFFGYGAQGDRYLINQTASNGLLYTFASSGIVGLIFFLTLTLTSGAQVLKYFVFSKKKVLIHNFSFFIMVIFLIRSLVETSYSLFGIDLILFYTAFVFMQRSECLE